MKKGFILEYFPKVLNYKFRLTEKIAYLAFNGVYTASLN